jgi:hypothetical protein
MHVGDRMNEKLLKSEFFCANRWVTLNEWRELKKSFEPSNKFILPC